MADCKAAAQRVGDSDVETLLGAVNGAGRIVCFGVGREGLALKAFAMRLHHLGFQVPAPLVSPLIPAAQPPGR